MLAEKDEKYLRSIERDPRWMPATILIVRVFFVVSALLQLYAAAQFANAVDLGLWDVVRGWHMIPEARAYHPFEAAAIKKVEGAFCMILLAFVFAVTSSTLKAGRARDKRIGAFLREKGLLERQDV